MIISLYALPLVLIYGVLTYRVIIYRRTHLISLGDDGNKSLMKRMRAHSNFVETVPLAMILIMLLELSNAPAVLIHGLCIALVIGRALHAYGFSASPPILTLRVAGMAITLITIAICGVSLPFFAL
ncbi:MAG: MAPEG family protein [Planktomarina sp.]